MKNQSPLFVVRTISKMSCSDAHTVAQFPSITNPQICVRLHTLQFLFIVTPQRPDRLFVLFYKNGNVKITAFD